MDRKQRKLEHINVFLKKFGEPKKNNGFNDIKLVHQSIPEGPLSEVDISVSFLGKKLDAPIIINAITGGHPDTLNINKMLARAARKTGVAMAVGSMKAALEDSSVENTFAIAREENPEGIILANLSAACEYHEAEAAVEMIKADGLQLHLNIPQELFMVEGECNFLEILPNIRNIVDKASFPVIAKEVGFGMSRESIVNLYKAGIKVMDISGKGGTNFIAIENFRANNKDGSFEDWGIPTAISVFEGMESGIPVEIIASGGINNSLDAAKALASGAKMVALAGPLLNEFYKGSYHGVVDYIEKLKKGLSKIMIMTGVNSIQKLGKVPLVITGNTAEWLIRRGVDVNAYAQRSPFKSWSL